MANGPDRSNAGLNRDRRFFPDISDSYNLRRILDGLGYQRGGGEGQDRMSVVLDGKATGNVTSVDLVSASDTMPLIPTTLGIPVAVNMTAAEVAVSFTHPSLGSFPPWTLVLHRKTGDGTFNQVATFEVATSI